MRVFLTTLLFLAISATSSFAQGEKDPLDSVMWDDMKEQFFAGAQVKFDDRVKVFAPNVLENQAQVPVTADARAIPNVKKLIVFADLNPIQHVLTLTPAKSDPFIAFRMKIEQATPVRAAALTEDGVWHVGGIYLDAAGGGCSSPALARNKPDWSITVGQTQGKLWRRADGSVRVRMRIKHPMDTGLTLDNIPAFFIERTDVRSESGEVLATVEMSEPVSEDPTLTMMMRLPAADTAVNFSSRDSSGSVFEAQMPAYWKQSQAPRQSDALVIR